jgi:hypothetical protein
MNAIFIWSLITGIIVAVFPIVFKKDVRTALISGIATFIAVYSFNWMIDYSNATIYLNVDHQILRVSWADLLDSIVVYAFVSFALFSFLQKEEYYKIKHVSIIAFIATLLVDTILF